MRVHEAPSQAERKLALQIFPISREAPGLLFNSVTLDKKTQLLKKQMAGG